VAVAGISVTVTPPKGTNPKSRRRRPALHAAHVDSPMVLTIAPGSRGEISRCRGRRPRPREALQIARGVRDRARRSRSREALETAQAAQGARDCASGAGGPRRGQTQHSGGSRGAASRSATPVQAAVGRPSVARPPAWQCGAVGFAARPSAGQRGTAARPPAGQRGIALRPQAGQCGAMRFARDHWPGAPGTARLAPSAAYDSARSAPAPDGGRGLVSAQRMGRRCRSRRGWVAGAAHGADAQRALPTAWMRRRCCSLRGCAAGAARCVDAQPAAARRRATMRAAPQSVKRGL
jgi:hypothetical protein